MKAKYRTIAGQMRTEIQEISHVTEQRASNLR